MSEAINLFGWKTLGTPRLGLFVDVTGLALVCVITPAGYSSPRGQKTLCLSPSLRPDIHKAAKRCSPPIKNGC